LRWFALAFLPMFGLGGLTGFPLGLAASDVTLHDTYYVVAHFHYLVAPGTVFALFAGRGSRFTSPPSSTPGRSTTRGPTVNSGHRCGPRLVLPINWTIVVQLTQPRRDSQLHAAADAREGRVTRTWFTPIKEGAWEIQCSQLCGLGHYRMRGEYRVVSRAAWEKWLAEETARLMR
jgi:hypothetical protein